MLHDSMTVKLPHPFVLLLGCVAVSAVLTWIIRQGISTTRRSLHRAAGGHRRQYARVGAAPIGLMAGLMAASRHRGRRGLLVLSRGLGFGRITALAMSLGAAVVGSAFGPTNPFQTRIALRFAEMPALSQPTLRFALFAAAITVWIGRTLAMTSRDERAEGDAPLPGTPATGRDLLLLAVALVPFVPYVIGVLRYLDAHQRRAAGDGARRAGDLRPLAALRCSRCAPRRAGRFCRHCPRALSATAHGQPDVVARDRRPRAAEDRPQTLVRVLYARDEGLDEWLPSSMEEQYRVGAGLVEGSVAIPASAGSPSRPGTAIKRQPRPITLAGRYRAGAAASALTRR